MIIFVDFKKKKTINIILHAIRHVFSLRKRSLSPPNKKVTTIKEGKIGSQLFKICSVVKNNQEQFFLSLYSRQLSRNLWIPTNSFPEVISQLKTIREAVKPQIRMVEIVTTSTPHVVKTDFIKKTFEKIETREYKTISSQGIEDPRYYSFTDNSADFRIRGAWNNLEGFFNGGFWCDLHDPEPLYKKQVFWHLNINYFQHDQVKFLLDNEAMFVQLIQGLDQLRAPEREKIVSLADYRRNKAA